MATADRQRERIEAQTLAVVNADAAAERARELGDTPHHEAYSEVSARILDRVLIELEIISGLAGTVGPVWRGEDEERESQSYD